MLFTSRDRPLVAEKDIACFKVMVKWKVGYYVCPPAFQYFLDNNKLEKYQLNTLYRTDSTNPEQDYRKEDVIGVGFFHTFCKKEDAMDFVAFLEERIHRPDSQQYALPEDATLVLLDAIIPQGALYYEGRYQRKSVTVTSYASNKVCYF